AGTFGIQYGAIVYVFDHRFDRFGGVGLIGADDARCAALDPARRVFATDGLTAFDVDDAAGFILDDAPTLLKGNIGQRHARVADGAEDEIDGYCLVFAGGARPQ